MAYIGKKTYRKRLYYRRRKYSRISRQLKNSDYLTCKINYQAAVIMENNSGGTAGIGWRFAEVGTWTNSIPQLTLSNILQNSAEFTKYASIYNEFKLLGVAIKSVPTYRAVAKEGAAQAFRGFVSIYFNTLAGFAGTLLEQDPLVLCPEDNSRKFWYNKNRHYFPCDLTASQLQTGLINSGVIYVGGSPNDTLQSYCPSWNIYIKIYLRLRKNRLNQ